MSVAKDLRAPSISIRSFSDQKNTFGKHAAKILNLSAQSRNVQELGGLELIEEAGRSRAAKRASAVQTLYVVRVVVM